LGARRRAHHQAGATTNCFTKNSFGNGSLAPARLDHHLHLRRHFRAVSFALPVGVCLGSGMDLGWAAPAKDMVGIAHPTRWENNGVALDSLMAQMRQFGQEHLLRFWEELSSAQRQRLAEQICAVDFSLLARLTADYASADHTAELAERAAPPTAVRLHDRPRLAQVSHHAGQEALRAGRIGAIVVAGGQGTRLGRDCPKGTIPVGPVSGRSLFQILFERILAVGRRFGAPIPLYVMTSPATHAATAQFLEEHDRFGVQTSDVHIFCQGVMPAVCATTGKVLMASRDTLCLAPNGHGGMLEALVFSGALDDARSRGVEHFFYCQVDNPLAPVCDPELIGLHLATHSEMTTLAVPKVSPEERVGNVVTIDGRTRILEYSELPFPVAAARNADGSLRLWAGNTGIHLFDAAFLRRAAADPNALPYHRALKATPCLDEAGRLLTPAAPNSVKFERFIFDLLPQATVATVIEAAQEDVFSPVKNASGQATDTPETAQAAMSALYRRWLHAFGVDASPEHAIEINPLFALDPEELAAKLPAGLTITGPTYLA
jgi:UDP-N-acetylglucosamine/UDP-N-acetylgalactosamine diphosphorylase